jgi:hypothetical protein
MTFCPPRSQFLDEDVPLFRGILSDLFPGVTLPAIDYTHLTAAIRGVCGRENLQPLDSFIDKIIQVGRRTLNKQTWSCEGEAGGRREVPCESSVAEDSSPSDPVALPPLLVTCPCWSRPC